MCRAYLVANLVLLLSLSNKNCPTGFAATIQLDRPGQCCHRLSMNKFPVALAALLSASLVVSAKDYVLHSFKKIQLSDKFWCEGANFGDFNHDGKMDVVSGPYWYEGPEFKKRHEFAPANASFKRQKSDGKEETVPGFEGALGTHNAYSECFLTFTYDFNGDGWMDILVYG